MRLIRLVIVFSIIPLGLIKAQPNLTLQEALRLGYENNIELKRQSSIIDYAEIDLKSATTPPNPEFSYSREDLDADEIEYNEWSALGSLPVNFLWENWSNRTSKSKALEARRLYYNNLKWSISSEIRKTYSLLQHYSQLYENLEYAVNEISKLSEAAKHRLSEGDISEYESRRILLEVSKLKITLKNAQLQKISYENSLKILTGIDASENILIDTLKQKFEINISKEEIMDLSLKNRSDLKALQLTVESGNSLISHNKLKAIPQINLSAGYKSQSDNLKGTVFQIGFEIPIFNRNQRETEISRLEVNQNKNELAYLRNKIRAEAAETYERYMINKNLDDERKDFRLKDLFETAAYSYGQGETTLVEFLDGVNAFIDGMLINSETETSYIKSYYELEQAIETSINEI